MAFTGSRYGQRMTTFVMRLWIPDRPGVLGAVASRVGAVGGDVVGIEILERGADKAVDELVVVLEDDSLVELLVSEVTQVDDVAVEEVRALREAWCDPRLEALETAAVLVGAATPDDAVDALCEHALRSIGARWGVVVALDDAEIVARRGSPPAQPWLRAYVTGSQATAGLAHTDRGPEDIVWAPLPAARRALVLGRDGTAFRSRERRQAAALARIVDTRFRELRVA